MADEADDERLKGKQVRNFVVYYIKCCVIRYSSMCNLIVLYLKAHYDYDLAHKYEGYGKIRSDWCSNFNATRLHKTRSCLKTARPGTAGAYKRASF